MYTALLFLHSWIRWISLILFLIVIVQSFIGMSGNREYGKRDNALSASLVGTLHLQLLIGLVLYFFLSPITSAAFSGDVSPMKDANIRFWAVEHISVMIIGLIVAQIGRSRSRKLTESASKFKTQAIFYTISLVLILSRIPWSESARLFRF